LKKNRTMDERDHRTTDGPSPPGEEEAVRRLLEMAGPRPPIPQEDLDAISAAARLAWREEVRKRAGAAVARPRRPLRALALGLAAALALAIGLAGWWGSRSDRVPPTAAWVEAVTGGVHLGAAANPITAGEPVPLGAALRSGGAGSEGRASLRLAGGATVRLDAGTRLRFASAGALELEHGALYVDTGSGPRRPTAIEVRTPLGTVRDVGTRFAVRIVEPGKAALLVRVRDGEVLTEHRGRTYRTPAGRELTLHRDGTVESRGVATHGAEWDWVLRAAPGFDIEGRNLREFLDWVSRETGWRVLFADSGLADSAAKIVLHGGIGDLRPDRAPFAVLPGAGLSGKLEDGTLVIRRLR
jgi:ferric-dicitrate binding protein FerR (iron transport regulator)